MDELSQLVGAVYDAALDPDGWPLVLGLICRYVRARYAILIVEDATEPGRSRFHASERRAFMDRYIDEYMLINPMRLATAGQVQAGEVVLTPDFMTHGQYRQTRFFKELLAGNGLSDVAAAVLDKTATTITVLSLLRGEEQGAADDALRERLRLLVPHVRRAALIGQALQRATSKAAALSDTLDRLRGAVFLLDAAGTVLHANEHARCELSRAGVLRLLGGKLVPAKAFPKALLAEALATAAQGGTASPVRRDTSIVLAPGDGHGGAVVGTVVPLAPGAHRPAGERHSAVAALFVRPSLSCLRAWTCWPNSTG